MLACWTVLFDLFRPLDDLLEIIANDAVDSFPVLLWQIIECNGDFQHLQLFDLLFVFTDFGGYVELDFCSIGAVCGGLLFGEIPMFQSYRYAQPDELTAAVLGEYEGKRSQMVSVDSIFSTYNVDCLIFTDYASNKTRACDIHVFLYHTLYHKPRFQGILCHRKRRL